MEENWKPVPSYDGLIASSFGRVCLPKTTYAMPNGFMRTTTPKPTFGVKRKASKKARHQYFAIYSKRFGNIKVHRAVCEAFHGPAPNERSVVIHLDENALNNRPENLRWGTQKENLNMPGFIAYCKSRIGDNSPVVKHRKQKQKF